MEIEKKWMVAGWPEQEGIFPALLWTEYQEQGYVHAGAPIVRIRLEARIVSDVLADEDYCTPDDGTSRAESGVPVDDADRPLMCPCATQKAKSAMSEENTKYVLCFKSEGLLAREEIEIEISREHFDRLAGLIGQPLIGKVRRVYRLYNGLKLEVNLVDEGLSTEFMYAEVEFESEEAARSWNPADFGLGEYLFDDVTEKPGQSMSAYWARTRG